MGRARQTVQHHSHRRRLRYTAPQHFVDNIRHYNDGAQIMYATQSKSIHRKCFAVDAVRAPFNTKDVAMRCRDDDDAPNAKC